MSWQVDFHPEFLREFNKLSTGVQDEIAAGVRLLQVFGPRLGRPHADTLKGSKHTNMK